MSLNKTLMDEFKKETGLNPIYNQGAATFHTLKYVDWLEAKLSSRHHPTIALADALEILNNHLPSRIINEIWHHFKRKAKL